MPNIKSVIIIHDGLFELPYIVVLGNKVECPLYPTKKNTTNSIAVIECDIWDGNGIRIVYEGEYFITIDYGVNKQLNRSYGAIQKIPSHIK